MSTICKPLPIYPHTHIYTPHTQCTHTHMHAHTCICTYTHTRTRTRTRTRRRTRTRTHTHTHTHTQKHTQTHTQRESSITCALCSVVALRKAGLNNKKQRGESHLVSCFISTSNALALEHPGYHDMKDWGEDKQSHDCPLSSTLRYCHTRIVVFRKIGRQE